MMEPPPVKVRQLVETSKRLTRLLRDWQDLPARLDHLRIRKDCACVERHLA